jgi:hypothetical protein
MYPRPDDFVDGYKFNQTQTLTVMDEVNGHKVRLSLSV